MSKNKKQKNIAAQKEENTAKDDTGIVLTEQNLKLQLRAANKTEAIRQVADFLIENGSVELGYKEGMLQREQEVSTFLMNGVAIPHGTRTAIQYIKQSDILIAQFPQGVKWTDDGDMVYVVCGIASNTDAHLTILANLTSCIQDASKMKTLSQTKDTQLFVDWLTKKDEDDTTDEATEIKGVHKTFMFTGENGMHARPATELAKMAKGFADTEVIIRAKGKQASAKSMPLILILNISPQTEITVSANGPQQDEALATIVTYIEDTLNHEKATVIEKNDNEDLYAPLELEETSKYFEGVKASPGIVVGPVFVLEHDEFDIVKHAGDVNVALQRFAVSLERAKEQLTKLKKDMLAKKMSESAIVDAHLEILCDDIIVADIKKEIQEKSVTASFAVHKIYSQQVLSLEQLDDETLRARADDMKDIRTRLLRILEDKPDSKNLPTDKPFILVSKELTPTQTATLHQHPVLGICTELGGQTSHMAILARALGLPSIVGAGKKVHTLTEDQVVVLDAQAGRIITNPSEALIKKANNITNKQHIQQQKEAEEAMLPAVTEDGVHIDVVCNIAQAEDSKDVIGNGGEGVGLFRTEFLFENSKKKPDVKTQYKALLQVVKELGARPVIVRVMDIGGDKPVSWLPMQHEENPFLGIRGIRLLLRNEDIFKDQLASVYKVAKWQQDNNKPITCNIMFPMIARTSEFLRAKKIALEVQESLQAPNVPLGIMIETPSSALIAKHISKEVDFFSIGTNDLTQYTLAMDRVHPELSKEADSLHPSILGLIHMSVEGGALYNTKVGVCGNMAADPIMLTALIAIGVRDVSVSPANVPAVKYLIRRLNTNNLQILRDAILNSGSGTEVRKQCESYFSIHLVPKL